MRLNDSMYVEVPDMAGGAESNAHG